MDRLFGSIAMFLLALCAIGIVGFFGFKWWEGRQGNHQLAGAVATAGNAVVGQGQARAQNDTTQIVVTGQRRDQLDINVHQENARAITNAPGADAPLDPAYIAAVNSGMSRYGQPDTSGHDPDGLPVQPHDPGVVPSPDPQRSTPF